MSDAVMVPREEMKFAIAQAIWEIDRNESTAARTLMVAAQNLLTAASTPVGGWEDAAKHDDVVLRADRDGKLQIYSSRFNSVLMTFERSMPERQRREFFARLISPPPSVSIGSRPQEAVPSEQAGGGCSRPATNSDKLARIIPFLEAAARSPDGHFGCYGDDAKVILCGLLSDEALGMERNERDELVPKQPADGWQTIATAPKDGKDISQ